MIKTILGLFSEDLSIDLGTANTLIYAKDRGVVLDEPSVVAVRIDPPSVIAVGTDAKRMLGRNPKTINVIRPMKDGQIADFKVTNTMLAHFIKRANQSRYLPSYPRVIICIPCESTDVEKQTIRQSAKSAGAREVYLIEEPLAAAVGAGLPIHEAGGNMVVDIGGGTTDIAILSLGGIVTSRKLSVAGDKFDDDIRSYVRRSQQCQIGELVAEQIKVKMGTAVKLHPSEEKEITVQGQSFVEGRPKQFVLSSEDIYEALKDSIGQIVTAILRCLEETKHQLAAEIAEDGIILTGGGALLSGLDVTIRENTGIPVMIAKEPLRCVAAGCGKILNDGNAPLYQV